MDIALASRQSVPYSLRKPNLQQSDSLLAWIKELEIHDPVCAEAVTDRVDSLLLNVSVEALGRWILTGLRLHCADRDSLRAYLSLANRHSLESLRGEHAAGELSGAVPSLGLLLNGLLGRPIVIQPFLMGELQAPPLRPVLTTSHLLLPDDYTLLDGPDRYRLYRTVVAHAVAHLRFSIPSRPAGKLKPMSLAVMSAVEDARVERLLVRDLSGVRTWFVDALGRSVKHESLSFTGLISRMNLALMDHSYEDGNHWVCKARALFEKQVELSLDDYGAFRQIASILANDLGQMRVPFRPQQYVVPAAYRDDNSFLWAYTTDGEPPPSLHLEVPAPLRSKDFHELVSHQFTLAQEIELSRQSYPEWDKRAEIYRKDWCTVIEKLPAWRKTSVNEAVTISPGVSDNIRLTRTRLASQSHRLRRQREGDELDLNAAIEAMVARRVGVSSDSRLFIGAANVNRATSVLVLLDFSQSTNDRLEESGSCLLDIEKQAALMLARAVTGNFARIAIHGFSSNTRAEVSYYRLLEFGVPLDGETEALIAAAPGLYSTRMGAALRHATSLLNAEESDRHAILLVTDGAPSDIDVYDTNYLIEDARVAVNDARRANVRVHCITVEKKVHVDMQRIFGRNHFDIVERVQTLPERLCRAYAHLSAA